ncbi:MAG: recombinase family protein [Methylococcaceae bacterium]
MYSRLYLSKIRSKLYIRFYRSEATMIYGYTRVSTLQQANGGESLETQKKIIIGYAQSRGQEIDPCNIFVEAGVSGSVEFAKRPKGSKLFELLNSGDMLIIPKIDRGFRNIRDALNTLHELKLRNVSVHFIDLGGDATTNGMSQILFTILGAFADFERTRIAQRISEVKQEQKAKGFWVGGTAPFGYLVNEEGRLEADPERSKELEAIFRWRTEGYSYRRIAEKLEREFGVKLSFMSVKNLLDRRF